MSAKSEQYNSKFTVPTTVEVSYKRIADLLVGAFEGGSNYWIVSAKKVKPPEWLFLSDPDLGREEGGKPSIWLGDYVLNPGGQIVFKITDEVNGSTTHTLDLEKVKKGVELFLAGRGWGKNDKGEEKIYMRHAANFLQENDDAETSDVFLQICLFGEVIFG